MQDKIKAVLQTFVAYAKDFETHDPEKIASYFLPNATIMTTDQVAFMADKSTAILVFKQLLDALKQKGFKYSKLNSVHVKQLGPNQAIVSGSATRYRSDDTVIETFGLTYTLREDTENSWKIIFGVIHDTVIIATA